jgi:hypothetical protein
VGYTKITKSDKIVDLKNIHTPTRVYHFWCSLEYKVLEHEFLHDCVINSWPHPIFFNFLKTQKI